MLKSFAKSNAIKLHADYKTFIQHGEEDKDNTCEKTAEVAGKKLQATVD